MSCHHITGYIIEGTVVLYMTELTITNMYFCPIVSDCDPPSACTLLCPRLFLYLKRSMLFNCSIYYFKILVWMHNMYFFSADTITCNCPTTIAEPAKITDNRN